MSIDFSIDRLRPIHPFPARMAPSIAMSELSRSHGVSLKVLDPMVGSGTTTVLSKMLGHKAYGYDVDPLAVLQAGCWAMTFSKSELLECGQHILSDARIRYKKVKVRDSYPLDSSEETKKFIRFWFDITARRQLRALAQSISELPPDLARLMWVCYSRMIIAKNRGVSLAMDLSHSRPHKVYDRAPVRPFDVFLEAVHKVADAGPFITEGRCPKSRYPDVNIKLGDARRIPCRSNLFDLVITSPPYLNAIDYIRCSKFALVWMGHEIPELRETRSNSIGSEVSLPRDESDHIAGILSQVPARKKLPARTGRMLDRYVRDMHQVISETSRVLKHRGRAVFVVGDSRVKGVFVSNSRIVERLSLALNLKLVQRERRQLKPSRRYMPPPKSKESGTQMQQRMGYEVILRFERTTR